jgi:hypothetical protein
VRDPEELVAEARRRAAARGQEQPDPRPFVGGAISPQRLAEWAIIEPERAEVYSTRRFGRPITMLKQMLIRLLDQYLGQISAQQSRFNAQIAAHLVRLEQRVTALEQAAARRDDGPPQ